MEPTPELIDALYREEVEAARRMDPAEKLIAPARLFDFACSITRSGIKAERPGASEAEILQLLRERLRMARRTEAGT